MWTDRFQADSIINLGEFSEKLWRNLWSICRMEQNTYK